MWNLNRMQPKIALFSLCTLIVAAPAMAQGGPPVHVGGSTITGFPHDWSHRHVVFSNPGTEADAIAKGKYAQWQSVVNDPRYVLQQMKHNGKVEGPAASDVEYARLHAGGFAFNSYGKTKKPTTTIERDWTEALGGAGLADGQFPAKYNYYTTFANCSDYVVFPTGAASGSGQATIVAYNTLYSGCSGFNTGTDKPNVYWAYNTGGGTAYTATTSPVLSADGTQVAFVQNKASNPGKGAQLVLLKMTACSGCTVSTPASAGSSVALASYRSCAAPCFTAISLGTTDTNSAPFYLFGTGTSGTPADTIFVGDDAGLMHQVTGVFNGTPAIDVGSKWPVTVAATALTSPVYDSGTSGNIFVGDAGGHLNSFTAGTANNPGTVVTSGVLETGDATLFDPPLLDSTNELVYAFVGYGGDTGTGGLNHPSHINIFPASGVTSGGFGSGNANFDNGSATTNPSTSHMRAGTFDDAFYEGASSTGHFYQCENGVLYRIAVTAGALTTGTFTSANTVSTPVSTVNSTSTCSPVTEFLGTSVSPRLTTSPSLSASATSMTVVSATGISSGDYLKIDSEIMVAGTVTGNTVNIATRGANGTTAASHNFNALVQDVQDWLFMGVANNASSPCSVTGGGCVFNYNVISSPATASPAAGLAATGGTSGIVIDSSSTAIAGDEEIYYTQLTGTNAIQASQSGLQ